MTDDPRRRALMRQGFLFLFLALVLGLSIIALPHPSRWLAAHLTAFLTGRSLPSSRSSSPVSLFPSAWCCTGCEALRRSGELLFSDDGAVKCAA